MEGWPREWPPAPVVPPPSDEQEVTGRVGAASESEVLVMLGQLARNEPSRVLDLQARDRPAGPAPDRATGHCDIRGAHCSQR